MHIVLRGIAFVLALTIITHMFPAGVFAAGNSSVNLSSDDIFHRINDLRLRAGLPTFMKSEALCGLAESRRDELYKEIFTGTIHAGLKKRKLAYWVTENMKFGSSEGEVISWWLRSPIHRKALYSTHKYSCGICEGRVCIALFTDYKPK